MEYITSDYHLGHSNIIKYCLNTRSFKNSNEMDKFLIEHWNNIVSNNDTIYHLGDLSFKKGDTLEKYLKQLNGNKIFILGNHDYDVALLNNYGTVHQYLVKDFIFENNKVKTVMFHYPIASWDGQHYGSLHFHGHTHGSVILPGRALDVGFDNLGKIISIQEAIQLCYHKPIASLFDKDHHSTQTLLSRGQL